MKTDRRVVQTRHKLQSALIQLMVERGYDNLTVQHVLDRADVSRSTFYSHFTDKEELFVSSIANLRMSLTRQWQEEVDAGAPRGELCFVKQYLSHIAGNHQLWQAVMKGESGRIMTREFRIMLVSMTRKDLGIGKSATHRQEAAVACVVGSLMSLVEVWMEGGARESAQQIQDLFLRLTLPGLRAVLA